MKTHPQASLPTRLALPASQVPRGASLEAELDVWAVVRAEENDGVVGHPCSIDGVQDLPNSPVHGTWRWRWLWCWSLVAVWVMVTMSACACVFVCVCMCACVFVCVCMCVCVYV